MKEEQFKVEEKEISFSKKYIKFKFIEDEKKFKGLSKRDRYIINAYILQAKLVDGLGSVHYLTPRQKIVIEEIFKYLYQNEISLLSTLEKEIKKIITPKIRSIGKQYDDNIKKILDSENKWILVKKDWSKKTLSYYKSRPETIRIILARMRPQFIGIRQVRKISSQYTSIKITPLGFFVGKLLSRDDIYIKEEEVIKDEEFGRKGDDTSPNNSEKGE